MAPGEWIGFAWVWSRSISVQWSGQKNSTSKQRDEVSRVLAQRLTVGEQKEMPAGCDGEGHGNSKSKEATVKNKASGDFPGGPVAKTLHSQCRGPGSILGQGTRSQVLYLRPAWCSQINNFFFLNHQIWSETWVPILPPCHYLTYSFVYFLTRMSRTLSCPSPPSGSGHTAGTQGIDGQPDDLVGKENGQGWWPIGGGGCCRGGIQVPDWVPEGDWQAPFGVFRVLDMGRIFKGRQWPGSWLKMWALGWNYGLGPCPKVDGVSGRA